ncbi:MAG: SIS domain-containing protein [Rhodospirillales bacterium]
MSEFLQDYIRQTNEILDALDADAFEAVVAGLGAVRERGGRLFILGVGGSAGHASHAVNDFRKICGFEAYTPTDNVSELTARINDDGWDSAFAEWLKGSGLAGADGVLVFSVGGGDAERNVSTIIIEALRHAKSVGAGTFGIVGSADGYTAKNADACIVIPPLHPDRRTPHAEGLCAVLWHALVTHPALKVSQTKWESVR